MLKQLLTLTCLLFFMFEGLYSQDKAQSKIISRDYSDAIYLAQNKDFEEAIKLLKKVYKKNPQSPEVNYYLGYCYLNNQQSDSAIIYLEEGLSKLPDADKNSEVGVDMQYSLSKAYHFQNRPDEAIREYEKLLAILPADDAMRQDVTRDIETCENLKEFLKKPVSLKTQNAGKIVNSKYDDNSPLISVDGNTLFFTTRRTSSYSQIMPDGQYSEKIFYSVRNSTTNEWSKPAIINKLFDKEGHESCVSLSADGQELYLFRNEIDGKNLYVCYFDGTAWGEPVKLPKPINTEFNETHITLSPDKTVAYFTSDRPGGLGGLDIYEIRKLPNGEWAMARNMGPTINTPYDEETPMLHPDGKTLYFASEGHNSMGGFDNFITRQNADSTWRDPVNLGYPINTADDDFFFVPTVSYNQAWYASSRFKDSYGRSDLYAIEYEVPEESRLAVIKGNVNSSDEAPIENIRIAVREMPSTNLIGQYRSHPGTGNYVLILEANKDYEIQYSGEGFQPYSTTLKVLPAQVYVKTQKCVDIAPVQLIALTTPATPGTSGSSDLADKSATQPASGSQQASSTDGIPFYTVQILTRKGPVGSWEKAFSGLDLKLVKEYKCKNNMYRYAYGEYKGFKATIKAKEHVLEVTTFQDSFIRDVRQYDELIEQK